MPYRGDICHVNKIKLSLSKTQNTSWNEVLVNSAVHHCCDVSKNRLTWIAHSDKHLDMPRDISGRVKVNGSYTVRDSTSTPLNIEKVQGKFVSTHNTAC